MPYRLRYALAWDHRLCRAVLAVFVRAVLGFERRRARRRGVRDGVGGAVTAIQRFGSALNTNVHFHTLVAQGVFFEKGVGTLGFAPAPAPTDHEVARLLAAVRRRILRLVKRHGIDRERLDPLCRYVLRPPVAQEALELTPDGKVQLRLRRPWSDGTRAIRFEPSELLEKLAAMIPKPRINLLVYHGVFAPNARCRRSAVHPAQGHARGTTPQTAGEEAGASTATDGAAVSSAGRAGSETQGSAHALGRGSDPPPSADGHLPRGGYTRHKHHAWADLLSRTFEIDVLACPGCGGRLRLIATIEHRAVIDKILSHLGLPVDRPEAAPPRRSAWLPGFEAPADRGTAWPG